MQGAGAYYVAGATENDGHENDGPSKLQDMKKTDQIGWHENAGHEIAGPNDRHEIVGREFAGHKNAMHEIAGHENARHEIGEQTTEK